MTKCARCRHEIEVVDDRGMCDNCARIVAQGHATVAPLIERAPRRPATPPTPRAAVAPPGPGRAAR